MLTLKRHNIKNSDLVVVVGLTGWSEGSGVKGWDTRCGVVKGV